MATAPVQNTRKLQKNSAVDRYFFTFVATSMIGISLVGFVPSIANPAERRAPVSACRSSRRRVPRVACTFPGPEQASSKWRVVMHRRLGIAGVFLLLPMLPSGYWSTIVFGKSMCPIEFCNVQFSNTYRHGGRFAFSSRISCLRELRLCNGFGASRQ